MTYGAKLPITLSQWQHPYQPSKEVRTLHLVEDMCVRTRDMQNGHRQKYQDINTSAAAHHLNQKIPTVMYPQYRNQYTTDIICLDAQHPRETGMRSGEGCTHNER
eukprot:12321358-Ditylum_brightwellii.AAC.1